MNKFFIFFILSIFLPALVSSAGSNTLKISLSADHVSVGQQVMAFVVAESPSQAMNATSGTLVFPSNLSILELNKTDSIVNFWTQNPTSELNKIKFEGVILNPGYQGKNGKIFSINFIAKKTGSVNLYFKDGAILANDGFGTNILDSLGKTTLSIGTGIDGKETDEEKNAVVGGDDIVLPIITHYSKSVEPDQAGYLKGVGKPNALTKIVFKDTSFKSVGERFIEFLQTKKKKLDEVLVRNNKNGEFEYITSNNLLAGVYNATPFLVDDGTKTERVGSGVQFLVNDSNIVKNLVVLINILALLIPVVGLIVIIYFIPWYSFWRMRILRKKMDIEGEKLDITEQKLKKVQDTPDLRETQ